MKVVVAGRLSRKVADRDQTGFDSQEREAVRWAEREGHEVVAVVADYASGRTPVTRRTNLRPWIEDANRLVRYDALAGLKVDRLTRGDEAETAELEQWARDHGKTLMTVDGCVYPSSGQTVERIKWGLMTAQAHDEWLKISERYRRMQALKREQHSLVGRPVYGYRIVREPSGRKTLEPVPEKARDLLEAAERYLAGEALDRIAPDYGLQYKTLAKLFRNPALAGRRQDASGRTVLRYPGIFTWDLHKALVARLKSRGHRRGISPGNAAMLSGVLHDPSGHPMYPHTRHGGKVYYCRVRGCGSHVPLDGAESAVDGYLGINPRRYMVDRVIPGEDHSEAIDQLRLDRAELDDLDPDYEAQSAALTAEIRRLASLPKEPSKVVSVDSGKTYGDVWQDASTAERRDMLLDAGIKVTALGDGRYIMAWPDGTTISLSELDKKKENGGPGIKPDPPVESVFSYPRETQTVSNQRQGFRLLSYSPSGRR
jgi:DNA invertase Pin-like site-specific DNA recombinase